MIAASGVVVRRLNAPAASYWLRRVLDDRGRRPRLDESIVQGVSGRSLKCITPLLNSMSADTIAIIS